MKNEIGVMLNNLEPDRIKAFGVAAELGFRVVHTNAVPEEMVEGAMREKYIAAAKDSGLMIAAMFIGFAGQDYSDCETIRRTVGLTIPELRAHRTEIAKKYSPLAAELGVDTLAGHLGFLTKDTESEEYCALIEVMRELLDIFAANGQRYLFETGQESAEELLTFINRLERENIGVNFDPGNFILYGTDDPVTALTELLPFVNGVHCKDGLPPIENGQLGTEVQPGDGNVDFSRIFCRLKDFGYDGPYIIEREAGANPKAEILEAKDYLGKMIANC